MRSTAALSAFVRAHRRLLWASYGFDLVLLPVCLLYLTLPLALEGLSPANLGFLGLGALIAFLYHIHIIRTYTGGPAFYLTVAINRWLVLIAAFAAALLPFIICFTTAALLLRPDAPLTGRAVYIPLHERIGHCITVFFFLKVLTPPVLVMSRTHPALLLLIPVGLGGAWAVGTLVTEMTGLAAVGSAAFLLVVGLLS
ncbi:MAG: hypothetical protein GF331_22625, partial [Chitinivibrionales bacterium]|nr:hypothetical protein [Chitinivibrionales bacterium]